MSLVSRDFVTTEGLTYLISPYIYGTRLLSVKRNGVEGTRLTAPDDPYSQPVPVPGNIEYVSFGSIIIFDPTIPFIAGEIITVLYEI